MICNGLVKGKLAAGVQTLLENGEVAAVLGNVRSKCECTQQLFFGGGMRRQNCGIGSAAKTSKTLRCINLTLEAGNREAWKQT